MYFIVAEESAGNNNNNNEKLAILRFITDEVEKLLAGIGELGSLIGGASAIANTVTNKKSKDKELEKQFRHNKKIEGQGITVVRKLKKKRNDAAVK